jgi:hypothetical protein
LKGFGLGLSQKPKHVGRHKGGWCWASKCKPKIQPKSQPKPPKIGVTSPKVVLVLTASPKVALLLTNVGEEVWQDGLLPACLVEPETIKLTTQISQKANLVLGTVCVDDVGSAITKDRPQQFIDPPALVVDSQNLPKPVKYYHRKFKARRGSKTDVSLLVGEWFSVINAPTVLPLSFD